ncbi:putative LPS assembly protein LptD [Pseudoflavitalea sp. G-6-1-2]|uniref:putative LPS assembly protein LptD n=1 Tax=Pseudoflavitalea sp. G-6-1-2 TaxID=2728841 RepID=UPI001F0EC8CF|nr:putative LPS assembly protein LptD [Pseudoflavitalea sp. G-6-1-2]
MLITSNVRANYETDYLFYNSLTAFQDTSKLPKKDTIPVKKDSAALKRDTSVVKTDTFSIKMSKDSLDAPVHYQASDSMVLDVKTKRIILFSKASVKQKDMELTADSIEMDQPSHIVTAVFRRDTSGKMIGRPKMVQADSKMEADVIRYNFETQRGLTQSTITTQGEMIVQVEKMKKINENEYYGLRAQLTTCNLDTPHFAFRVKKLKLVNKKLAVSGPVHPEFEGVPVPIYLPFGFFPISQGRHSGLLPPTFTASEQFGLGLEGLGYYHVINDKFDVRVLTNIYSYGGWTVNVSPTYRKRYRYNGGMSFSMTNTRILSNTGKQEFTTTRAFNINWNHTMDNRARPGTSFTASVNAGSTKYNQLVTNNPTLNYNNQMSSSITYQKNWDNKYNLTLSANHNQNNVTQLINMSLPTAAFTVNTFYPFQSKDFVGGTNTKWYQKLGLGLNTNFANQISVYEKDFNMSKILDTLQWGAQHSIPIQLALPPLGPVTIAPGISYRENWYSRKLRKGFVAEHNKVDTLTNSTGFFQSREVSFSLGFNTAIFGMFNKFGKNSKVTAIRHVIRPNVSLSYKPDLAKKDWYDAVIDSTGRKQRFSYSEGSIYGAFGEGVFGGLSFGIDNNLEIKVRSKKDTANGGIKKVRILDGFGFNSNYNLVADSFRLGNFNLYARSTLFEKINISASATLDPYKVDENGYRTKEYMWSGGGGFKPGRITNGTVSVSTSFQSKPKDEKKAKEAEEAAKNSGLPPLTMEEQQAQLQYARQNPAEFADFNIPWSLNINFSYSFSRHFRSDYKGWETTTNASLGLNGDFNLTPRWKLGGNTFYDIKAKSIQQLTMSLSREMHCWQLSINVTPVGVYRSFNITINPKSGLLRDLKINRTRFFYGN